MWLYLPICSFVEQINIFCSKTIYFKSAAAAGCAYEDDSAVVKVGSIQSEKEIIMGSMIYIIVSKCSF